MGTLPWKMYSKIGHIQEKRFLAMPLNKVDAVTCKQGRCVSFRLFKSIVVPPVLVSRSVNVCVEVTVSGAQSTKHVESLIRRKPRWHKTEMPFAEAGRCVTLSL